MAVIVIVNNRKAHTFRPAIGIAHKIAQKRTVSGVDYDLAFMPAPCRGDHDLSQKGPMDLDPVIALIHQLTCHLPGHIAHSMRLQRRRKRKGKQQTPRMVAKGHGDILMA